MERSKGTRGRSVSEEYIHHPTQRHLLTITVALLQCLDCLPSRARDLLHDEVNVLCVHTFLIDGLALIFLFDLFLLLSAGSVLLTRGHRLGELVAEESLLSFLLSHLGLSGLSLGGGRVVLGLGLSEDDVAVGQGRLVDFRVLDYVEVL